MKTRCLIVDDEPLAIKLIEKHMAQLLSLEVVATCNSAMKAFEILNHQTVYLMFLDIKMPNMTGVNFLKTLRNPPKTILTTAYRDYAPESYDLDVVDYLLKPITFDRFFRAVDRFFKETAAYAPAPRQIVEMAMPGASEEAFIFIKSGNKYHKVAVNSILYVESLKDYIKVCTTEKEVISKYKIGDIAQELGDKKFLRVHRSYIVNLRRVTAFTHHDIEIGTKEIPIGVSYKERVLAVLNP